MKSIMVATDFSERSDRALRRATLLAKQFGAALTVVHVVDDDRPRRIVDADRDLAAELLEALKITIETHDGVACAVSIHLGAPFERIAKAVDDMAPDLLVIGPHRRRLLQDIFIGTTAERTFRSANCPVLMAVAPPVGTYRRVLIATDFSAPALHAAKCFFRLELGRGAFVSYLHVYDLPLYHSMVGNSDLQSSWQEQRIAATQALANFAVTVGPGWTDGLVRQRSTSPALDLLETAKIEGADLVVVGTHGRVGVGKYLLGSVAEEVLRSVDCDVLAVPPATESARP